MVAVSTALPGPVLVVALRPLVVALRPAWVNVRVVSVLLLRMLLLLTSHVTVMVHAVTGNRSLCTILFAAKTLASFTTRRWAVMAVRFAVFAFASGFAAWRWPILKLLRLERAVDSGFAVWRWSIVVLQRSTIHAVSSDFTVWSCVIMDVR